MLCLLLLLCIARYREEFSTAELHNEQLGACLGRVADDLHPVRVLQLFSAITDEVCVFVFLFGVEMPRGRHARMQCTASIGLRGHGDAPACPSNLGALLNLALLRIADSSTTT